MISVTSSQILSLSQKQYFYFYNNTIQGMR